MNTMEELALNQIKHNDQFPTRYEFIINDLVNDYINNNKESIINKLSDWDPLSTATILSDVLVILRNNKEIEIDEAFFSNIVHDKIDEDMAMIEDNKVCPECGFEIDDDNYCEVCGTYVEPD